MLTDGRWVSGLFKNFTRISPSEFEFLIECRKNVEKGHSVQESHFCSAKDGGTDGTFLGKRRIVR
jgi:hypothetical protein